MLDNDHLTYSPTMRRPTFGEAKLSERTLLTTDRSQKLDLLIHLLTNLHQSLIVCGPEGIGKTTLIKTLQNSHNDIWPICILQGSEALSFESITTQLGQFLSQSNLVASLDISSLQAFCKKQRVVLIIDDAGDLVPGLIGELIDFADSLPGLRLIFAMNYDEFQHKSDSDQAIDNCHFIELPPLNRRQCMEYLQNLSIQPNAPLSFNAINDTLVEELYRKTEGIPGKLLAELPMVELYQTRQNRKLGLWAGMTLILVAAAFIANSLLPSATDEVTIDEAVKTDAVQASTPAKVVITRASDIELEAKPEITRDTLNVDSQLITPENPQVLTGNLEMDQNPAPALTETRTGAEPSQVADQTEIATESTQIAASSISVKKESEETATPINTDPTTSETGTAKTPSFEQAQPTPPQKPAEPAASEEDKAEPGNSDLEWIMAQPPTNYTVQLMVLSYKNSVDRFMKKHADYRDNLKYYTIGKSGREKYVLIYGSFQSAADALKRKSTMPREFSQGIVKRFSFIQKDRRRRK